MIYYVIYYIICIISSTPQPPSPLPKPTQTGPPRRLVGQRLGGQELQQMPEVVPVCSCLLLLFVCILLFVLFISLCLLMFIISFINCLYMLLAVLCCC